MRIKTLHNLDQMAKKYVQSCPYHYLATRAFLMYLLLDTATFTLESRCRSRGILTAKHTATARSTTSMAYREYLSELSTEALILECKEY